MERVIINSHFGKYKVVSCKKVVNNFSYKLRVKCLDCGEIMEAEIIYGRILIVKCTACSNTKCYVMPIGDNEEIKGFRSLSEYYYKKYRAQALKAGAVGNIEIFTKINNYIIENNGVSC